MNQNRVGVLALQGSFAEHGQLLDEMRINFLFVRKKSDLEKVSYLIIPGGESTTMTKLLKAYDMWDEILHRIQRADLKIFGTCAGAILCERFGADFEIDRNAYGAQQDSFIDNLDSNVFSHLKGVFIRAPRFKHVGKSAKVLASYKGEPVLIQSGNILAATFHPELSGEVRVHEYFLKHF